MYLRWRRDRIILAALIMMSIVILTLHFKESEEGLVHRVQRITVGLMAPLQAGVSRMVDPFRHGIHFLAEIRDLKRENERLKREVAELKRDLISLKVVAKENQRLRRLIGFKEKTTFEVLPARIIGKSPTGWQAIIILDKGSADGVRKYMPVVVDEGLVGQVVGVSSHAAQIQLITDPKSGVSCQILSTGERGILQGETGGELKLNFIPKDSKVRKADAVITSGLGGVFPPGIFVGTVSEIKVNPYGLYKEVKVKSSVDFSKLEEVLIITNPPPKTSFPTEGG
ncbi:MAG: rod shape-determining protein MreC [Actinomycetota bacterium]|nr:rod shape-determining protein MreC [Actinomycetota bacterium]